MAMYAPAHPGRLIKADIEALGLSVAKAAEALGVTRSQLYRVIGGKSAVSPEMAIRLEAVIGSTADHWMRLQVAFDLAQVRKREAVLTAGLKKLEAA